MLGYYKIDNPGVLEPTPNGWYDTGDIVTIDDDNFITIQGIKICKSCRGDALLTHQKMLFLIYGLRAFQQPTIPDQKKGKH